MIIYTRLEKILSEKKISKSKLHIDTGISTNAISKFAKNEPVSLEIIDKICEYLDVQPGDIIEYVDEDILREKEEKKADIQAQIEELQKKLSEI